MPNIYESWGFSENPFTTRPLQADNVGERLLVGRDADAAAVLRRLETPPKATTLEGPNGVGKTSLVNVVVHRAYQAFVSGDRSDILIPTAKTFQLDANSEADVFVQDVLFEVAQTLLRHTEMLKSKLPASTTGLARWLNSPQLASWQGGLQVLVGGASVGRTSETNTSAGFARSGFRQRVEEWLSHAFPNGRGGGVVCILDNLELAETSARAKQLLENLRDPILTMSGLRWVLCGSSGIVRSVISSPRLEGILHAAIDVGAIDDRYAPDVLSSRVTAFAEQPDAYIPILSEDFEEMYQCLRGNMRNTLSKADDFCMWVAERGNAPTDSAQKRALFHCWFDEECTRAASAAGKSLGNRAWKTFGKAVKKGGSFSPSDFEEFGFENMQALRPSVRDLEQVDLLVSTQDDTDKRRKTIQVTPKGWMVARARSGALLRDRTAGAVARQGKQQPFGADVGEMVVPRARR